MCITLIGSYADAKPIHMPSTISVGVYGNQGVIRDMRSSTPTPMLIAIMGKSIAAYTGCSSSASGSTSGSSCARLLVRNCGMWANPSFQFRSEPNGHGASQKAFFIIACSLTFSASIERSAGWFAGAGVRTVWLLRGRGQDCARDGRAIVAFRRSDIRPSKAVAAGRLLGAPCSTAHKAASATTMEAGRREELPSMVWVVNGVGIREAGVFWVLMVKHSCRSGESPERRAAVVPYGTTASRVVCHVTKRSARLSTGKRSARY